MSSSSPSPGRRVAARVGRRPGPLGVVSIVLPVLAAVLVLVGARADVGSEAAATAESTPVDHVVLACLERAGGSEPEISTLAAPVPGLGAAGTLEATGAAATPLRPDERGVLQRVPAARPSPALVLTADGETAAGRAAFLLERDGQTLAAQDCSSPRSEWWFTGGGGSLDHRSVLLLTNADPGPAVVAVSVLADTTEPTAADLPDARELTVPPGEVVSVDLAEVAPQAAELSVHVETSRGRVSAALSDSFSTRPGAAAGVEWVPYQSSPQRFLRLAPVLPRADRRTLVVSNPSSSEALVRVKVAGAGGSFEPVSGAELRVPPGASVTADLSKAIGEDASAVTLESTVGVVAAVRSQLGADTSYATALPGLEGTAAAILVDARSAAVHLTGGKDGGAARVTAFAASGKELASADLAMQPGATVTWRPPQGADYVMVGRTSGRLFGGVVVTTPRGVTQVPLRPLPVSVERPHVVPALR